MRTILLLPASLLLLNACGQAQETPRVRSTDTAQAQEAATARPDRPSTQLPSPERTPASIQPCELLDKSEIQAIGFTEHEVGEPLPGTGVPLGLGEAENCQWEIGDPHAQFHERLYVYVFRLGPNETAESAFEGQAGRMQDTTVTSRLGDQAAYSETSQALLVRDGELLIYLRADVSASGDVDIREALISLAEIILGRA
jgi:hypothetical protein